MSDNNLLERYIYFLIKNKLTSKYNFDEKTLFKNFLFYLKNTFSRINFKDKTILDVGSGNGIFSFYFIINGAKEVVCLEPSLDGSDNNNENIFLSIVNEFRFTNIKFINQSLQNYITNKRFDLIVMKDSINHINEDACINLKKNNYNRKIYIDIFNKINSLMLPDSQIFLSDASSKNFFGDLKIKNPFVGEIEWFKHQEPNIWISLMKESDFDIKFLDWSSINSLQFLGKMSNSKLISYFTSSNFRIIAKK